MTASAMLGLLLLASVALAQTGSLAVTWSTVDGGGGTSKGGSYTLAGTVGQPDAGASSGGAYTLSGGFWNLGQVEMTLYMPFVSGDG